MKLAAWHVVELYLSFIRAAVLCSAVDQAIESREHNRRTQDMSREQKIYRTINELQESSCQQPRAYSMQ
jgi:hypothetical protein